MYFSQNKDGSKKYDTPLFPVNEEYFLGFSCIPKNQNLAKFTFSYAVLPNSKTYCVNENNFDLGTKKTIIMAKVIIIRFACLFAMTIKARQ